MISARYGDSSLARDRVLPFQSMRSVGARTRSLNRSGFEKR